MSEKKTRYHTVALQLLLPTQHTHLTALCPGLPRWAGTRKVKPVWMSGFYWSKRQWVAVASAGPYANLHLAPDRQPHQHPTQWCIGGVYGVYQPPGFFWQRILTSVIINKQCIFRPCATPLCVYPPPFLAIHHWPYHSVFHRPDDLPAAQPTASKHWRLPTQTA